MRNSLLNLAVTAIAKGNKVVHFICNIYNQIMATRIDVVDVQSPTVFATGSPTPAARLVSGDHGGANALPSAPVLEPFPAIVVGVILSNSPQFSTLVTTEFPSPSFFAGKRTVDIPALNTGQLNSGDNTRMSASARAMLNQLISRLENLSAYFARLGYALCLPPFLMAGRGTEVISGVFYLSTWTAEEFSAMGAGHLRRAFGALRTTFCAAQKNLPVISLELIPALGANLEHN